MEKEGARVSRALLPAAMGGHVGIARADICVARGAGWEAVAPVAAGVACSDAHLLP